MLTLVDLCEKLKDVPELELMDLLGITSEDIVERFIDKIEYDFDYINREFEEEDE